MKIQLCIDALTADVGDMLSKENGVSITEALQQFMQTKTYTLLFDEQSLLYLESAEYIYDMLEAEQSGDWQRWKEDSRETEPSGELTNGDSPRLYAPK